MSSWKNSGKSRLFKGTVAKLMSLTTGYSIPEQHWTPLWLLLRNLWIWKHSW